MREHGALSRVAVGWGENTVGESAPSELASCFVGGTTSERVEKKRGSHGPGFRVAGPSGGSGSVMGQLRDRIKRKMVAARLMH